MEKSFTLTDLSMYLSEVKALKGEFEPSDSKPSKLSLANIFGYARAVATYKTRQAGELHLLMN